MPNRLALPGLMNCRACPLSNGRIQVVPGYGEWPSPIMFMGEAPGPHEQRGYSRPFIGESGQLLRQMCHNVGWELDEFYVTNTVHCHPPQNRDPAPAEINACSKWRNLEIITVNPDIIIAVGAKAYKALLPDEESSITNIRGHLFQREIEGRKRWIMPTVHPAFVMRNTDVWQPLFESDLRTAQFVLDYGEPPDKPIPFRKDKAEWDELVEGIQGATKIGLDLEFDGPRDLKGFPTAWKADIVGIGIATAPGVSYYVPCPDPDDARDKIWQLRNVIESDDVVKVVSNVKAEKHVLRRYGIELRNYRDTLIEAWLLGWLPTMGPVPLALKDTWQRVFGTEMIRISSIIGTGKKAIGMREATYEDEDAVAEYAAQDPDASLRLHEFFDKEIQSRNLEELYVNVEMLFTNIIIDMERRGLGFDPSALEESRETLQTHLAESRERFSGLIRPQVEVFSDHQLQLMSKNYLKNMKKPEQIDIVNQYGYFDTEKKTKAQLVDDFIFTSPIADLEDLVADNLNPNSHPQVAALLYGEDYAGAIIPRPKRTPHDRIPPTDKVTLAEYAGDPVVRAVLEARATRKLLGTYIEALPKHVDETDGRIHSTISQTGTGTGRVSSSNPNVANIPARQRGEITNVIDPKAIRTAFVAAPGNLIYCFDLSQIEMRIQAHLADCLPMKEVFWSGGDIHGNTTEGIFQTTRAALLALHGDAAGAKMWDNHRYLAKTIGFGVLYGLTAQGLLARTPELELTLREAEAHIEGFFNTYPEIRDWQIGVRRFVTQNHFYETELHRRRYFPEVTARDQKIRAKALRECVNFPIQGGAADYFKLATIEVDSVLRENRLETVLINQVYDELVMEGPESERDVLGELIPPVMSGIAERMKMDIPVPVDFEYGHNWGELTEWKAAA